MQTDEFWMEKALILARRAEEQGEVPVGAVVVKDDECIGEGWNRPITSSDPTAHAEMVALRDAAQHMQNYRLPGTTIFVTLEPCVMCAGAIIHARINRVVYAADDPKGGAAGSCTNLLQSGFLNHQAQITAGILAEESRRLLQVFFREKRQKPVL